MLFNPIPGGLKKILVKREGGGSFDNYNLQNNVSREN